MKIIGGSFGIEGSTYIGGVKNLVIMGAQKAEYSQEQIQSVTANVTKEKKFGILRFIVGAIILGIVFGIFLNILGVVIGIVIAIAGSFYSKKKNLVEVRFIDNKSVNLECPSRDVKKLVQLAPSYKTNITIPSK